MALQAYPRRSNGPLIATQRAALFIALMTTALALGPPLAHLLELPNKIGLPKDAYFTVQQIYGGWNMLGALQMVQAVAIIAVILLAYDDRRLRTLALTALLCLASAQAMFWLFTFPANVVTENWTHHPDDWEVLRRQWEYSHATGALLQFACMACLVLGAVGDKPRRTSQ